MKNSYNRTIESFLSFPQLIYKKFTLAKSLTFKHKIVSKQSVKINTLENFIYNICNDVQKDYFNKNINSFDKEFFDKDFFKKENQYLSLHDGIQYFGSIKKFKVSFEFLYFYKKYKFSTFNCTVYAIQKCDNIPYVLKSAKTDFKIPDFPILQNQKIKYSLFDKSTYSYLPKQKTNLQTDIAICNCNLPYSYYSRALYLSDQLCCYDIDNNDFWFGKYNSFKKFQQLCNDIKKNGIQSPLVFKINNYGQLISSEDCNVRAIIALYLRLPYIPASVYNCAETEKIFEKIPVKDLKEQANQIFDPYFFFQ